MRSFDLEVCVCTHANSFTLTVLSDGQLAVV